MKILGKFAVVGLEGDRWWIFIHIDKGQMEQGNGWSGCFSEGSRARAAKLTPRAEEYQAD